MVCMRFAAPLWGAGNQFLRDGGGAGLRNFCVRMRILVTFFQVQRAGNPRSAIGQFE